MDILSVTNEGKPCYDIVLAEDFSGLGASLAQFKLTNRRVAVITDTNVGPIYADQVRTAIAPYVGKSVQYEIPAGEVHKNLEEIARLYEFLLKNEFDRHDVLIALGGGVVGDMTGFCAATYLRGISFVQAPTTLLSQTDSSIGGKTGVDYAGYKNMVGAFYMPMLVYIATSTLNSLNEREFAAGMAEVIKHGLIRDRDFYEQLKARRAEIQGKRPAALAEMIRRSLEIKRAVVEEDPKEQGERMKLNYGHTIGHAIEKAMDFSLLHGECVALGSIAAAELAVQKGMLTADVPEDIRRTFASYGLETSLKDADPEEIGRLVRHDKKMDGGQVRFILLDGIGNAVICKTVTETELRRAVRTICAEKEA